MGDLVTPTIKVINACINKYTDFCAFKEECVTFRQSLCNVKEVLEDVAKEIAEGSGSSGSNTRLRRPMELLQTATAEGGEVLKKCSTKRTLLAFVFSRQLMGMLNKAKADIEEAMRLLQVSSVRIQVSTRRVMDSVSDQLVELHKQINASYTSKHEVADLIRAEMQQHHESHGATMAEALSDVLVKLGVVNSLQDCEAQFLELQKEADSIRKAKVIYDEEMLEAVKALTAPRDDGAHATASGLEPPLRQGSEASSAVQECLVCPISGDIMRDPVTVMESGLTYDRESLCASLLAYPDLEPGTGQRFDRPLHYVPNIAVRQMIMAQHGDAYYQKHDDAEFKVQYEAKWKETPSAPDEVTKDLDGGWATFEAESAFAEPPSVAAIHSDWVGGGDPNDLFDSFSFGAGVASASNGSGGGVDREANKSEADIPGVKFGSSEETDHVDTMSADSDGAVGEAKPRASTKLGGTLRECWRSRRARWLVAGAAIVVLVVVVGIVVGASKPGPLATTEEQFNATLSPYTIKSLETISSPQYRAYEWVTQSDQVAERDKDTRLLRMTQRFALATVLYSLGLDNWVGSTVSECNWGRSAGGNVTCNANSEVEFLDLGDAGSDSSTSPFPREMALLTHLTYLGNGFNSLTGSIPTELGQLSALEYLGLFGNSLTSSIPTELGRLSALTFLGLSYNSLSSSIPTELGQLSALTYLHLYNNSLTSSIPTDLERLSHLDRLWLYGNRLSGEIPNALCSASSIKVDCSEVACSCCGCS
jgi:U-box domain